MSHIGLPLVDTYPDKKQYNIALDNQFETLLNLNMLSRLIKYNTILAGQYHMFYQRFKYCIDQLGEIMFHILKTLVKVKSHFWHPCE